MGVKFMGYIDIHAHIIPGIDDGPKTIEESMEMLHKAYNEGFTTIIATPHCSKGFCKYTKDDVLNHCTILDQYAKKHISSDFSVLPGQEIYYNEASMHLIHSKEIVPLAGSSYILLEFAPDVSFSQLMRGLREVSMSSYHVVLAHIERYHCLRDFENLKEVREMGIFIQMNYSDIGESWFKSDTRWCRKCLKKGVVDFLSTDMHDMSTRASKLIPALKWIQKNLDLNYIQNLMWLNAQNIFSLNE